MSKQTENDLHGGDGAAQRLRQMLRTAFLRRSTPKDESPARKTKSRKPKKTAKSKRN